MVEGGIEDLAPWLGWNWATLGILDGGAAWGWSGPGRHPERRWLLTELGPLIVVVLAKDPLEEIVEAEGQRKRPMLRESARGFDGTDDAKRVFRVVEALA